ncbi:MAG: hypothetical protein HY341_02760 [Candidatus Kerfeldbacteria bacterium]|nr:hypothetical protein [Candidatus Kerfeldbacteria bacterium]
MTRIAAIGVSEIIIFVVMFASVAGIVAMASTDLSLQLAIRPPKPPEIHTILGDPQTKSVMIVGTTSDEGNLVRVYDTSQPTVVKAVPDGDTTFLAVFTSGTIQPGLHEFSAVAQLADQYTTDPSPHVVIRVLDDFSVVAVPDRTASTVTIGNADAATSQLLRTIIHNQQVEQRIVSSELPADGVQSRRALIIQVSLFVIIFMQAMLLFLQRLRRKDRNGQGFFHVGKGFYRTAPPSSGAVQ